jgi:hypothetical protein
MKILKRYDEGGKFSLKDLIAAYKDTKPERSKISWERDELGLTEGNAAGDYVTTFLKNLTPEEQDKLLKSGDIDKVTERRNFITDSKNSRGASPTGGGGVTILKGEGLRRKYKGTDEGGIELSTRKGTINPFKRLKDALQSLKPQPKKYANPRFL